MMKHPIIAGIEKYKQHPSILKIKKQITTENYFILNILIKEMVLKGVPLVAATRGVLKNSTKFTGKHL